MRCYLLVVTDYCSHSVSSSILDFVCSMSTRNEECDKGRVRWSQSEGCRMYCKYTVTPSAFDHAWS